MISLDTQIKLIKILVGGGKSVATAIEYIANSFALNKQEIQQLVTAVKRSI